MAGGNGMDPRKVIGRSPESLSVAEQFALAGKFVAYEIYTPQTLPLHFIEAIGDSFDACVRMLKERGLDPRSFEVTRVAKPF